MPPSIAYHRGAGRIGSEVVADFGSEGWEVHDIGNNQSADLLGPLGDTLKTYDSALPANHAWNSPFAVWRCSPSSA